MERISIVNETGHKTSVLVAAKPSRARDSLCFLLRTMPGIEVIDRADDGASTLTMIAEHCPTLALLDTNLTVEGIATVLRKIKASGSQSRCLVLADDAWQLREAKDAGADEVLLKGFSGTELFGAIAGLLLEQEGASSSRIQCKRIFICYFGVNIYY